MAGLTDEQFLSSPAEWPRWPLLPLISLTKDRWDKEHNGIMIEDARYPFRVYSGCTIFDLGERPGATYGAKLAGLTIHDYPDAASLLKEWRID